jgi:hypothetical protein
MSSTRSRGRVAVAWRPPSSRALRLGELRPGDVISCGGEFDPKRHHYEQNVVVVALPAP